MAALTDRHGRSFPYLRLSLLEACNFRCSYCLPDGYHAAAGTPRWLGREEIARLLRGFAAVGLRKLRLTGGEPSLRTDLAEIIADAVATPGIQTVAMTSNGILLRRRFAQWRAAGLSALNVSLDSLDDARFHAITGRDRGAEVRAGIELALASDLPTLKLNAVLLRGLNDDELPAWLDYLRTRNLTVRFIELMQTGDNRDYFRRHHVRAEALEQSLQGQGWQLLPRAATAGPAREYAHPGFRGRIGIIAPYSRDFCAGCNRLRVTAHGDLRLCLFGDFGIPLRPLLQSDASLDELTATLHAQLGLKQAGHGLHEGRTGLTRHLASIGG
ncbi:GTP 3',8-cyclase MoaA [Cognatiluteimonas weifangensis]|uniref:GTP 3',8-cyclase n=1 Tax=Cognatiluteimonas weifangensis TaxID=2303539 RepID=A0A372DN48_9GAMM|nr:GTP 3',8-cyclase MoaA [Luteimonas weifangensis]RFP60924.1 GTP 3',8-cyclase MoaA [Luteimonas weifangensis]